MSRIRLAVAALLASALALTVGAQELKPTLKFKNEKNEFAPVYQEMTTDVVQVIKVQGQDLTQKQNSTFWFQWTPTKEEKVKEGNDEFTRWTIKQKIEGLKMDIDISGNPIKYDSRVTDTTGAAGNPGLLDFFKGLKDAEFTVTLGKNYKVEKVDGKDDFIKRLGANSAQMEALLKKVMTDEALKEMADPTYKLFPDGPKKKDETWERKALLPLGPVGTYDLTYKFKYLGPETAEGPKKGLDKIEVTTIIKYSAPKDNPEGLLFRIKEGSTLESDPEKSKGVIYYDPKNQWIDEATININLKGNLKVTIGGTDTTAELTQEQKTVIKSKGTSFIEAPKEPPKK